MENTLQKLLEQQQKFMIDLLGNQRSWMESQLEQQKLATQTKAESSISLQSPAPQPSVPAFPAYDKSKSTWEAFLAQLNQHFTAYKVTDQEQKRAFMLSWIGTETFELLTKLFGNENIQGKSYKELTDRLSEHFKSKVHVLASRYKFFKTPMQPNQTYADWIAELRGVARKCNYVCANENCKKEFVEELIRDIIVLNTPHESVRNKALQKSNPTLADVIAIAEVYEATNSVQAVTNDNKNNSEVLQIKVNKSGESHITKNPREISKNQSCSGCGTHHQRVQCKFRDAQCRKCHRFGHIAPVCNSKGAKQKQKQKPGKQLELKKKQPYVNRQENVASLNLLCTNDEASPFKCGKKYILKVIVNGVPMSFQIDSGATCSVIGVNAYKQIDSPSLRPANASKLTAFGGNSIAILGTLSVDVKYGEVQKQLPLIVANVQTEEGILGINWMEALGLSINHSNAVNALALTDAAAMDDLLVKFEGLFSDKLGHCKTYRARLHLKENANPKYCKARPLPFAQMEQFKKESERLIQANIWKPISFSSWAAPIVVIPKKDGSLRICGDFKAVNTQLKVDQHPIPRIDELLQKLRGGRLFSKIDLSDAYFQVELAEESKDIMVVNTPIGLFAYQRLPFGVASAPAIFQRLLEQVIAGIPQCANYLDDIIVTGSTMEEHIANLREVLRRLQEYGFTCKKSKCTFMQPKVEYLGYIIDVSGVHPAPSKIKAIKELPRPANLKDLQAFLGKINYYNKFIKNFSQTAAPLNKLRRLNEKFVWGEDQEEAFKNLKQQISRAPMLAHFDESLPIILATDASSHGIGVVISHKMPDGTEKPIAFASKTLDIHQKRYSQIEKEALSIIYGVRKFHQYLYGRCFTLLTDHQPLISIFSPDKQLPTVTLQRLQRWALILMAYRYKIQYRPTDKHANADALSRLPSGPDPEFDADDECCFQLEVQQQLQDFPLNAKRLGNMTSKDSTLRRVRHFIDNGWPAKLANPDKDLKPYFARRLALSCEGGVILLQTDYNRVVIPEAAQRKVLTLLHEGHWGMTRMKQLARRYCWWPNIDTQIEKQVANCASCQQHSNYNPSRKFINWPVAERPWQRIHLDFAGPFLGSTWLLCVDAFSRYPFVSRLQSVTTSSAIDALRAIFTHEGLPDLIVTDNGRQFTSREFQDFCGNQQITHLTTAPFHPASNGEAERFVRTFKQALAKAVVEGKQTSEALLTFLTTYRTTPNTVSGKSPAELLHGRQPKIPLALMLPQTPQPTSCTKKLSENAYNIGEPIYAKNFSRGSPWIPGVIKQRLGRVMYSITLSEDDRIIRRHQNQLKPRRVPIDADTAPSLPETPPARVRRLPRCHQQVPPA